MERESEEDITAGVKMMYPKSICKNSRHIKIRTREKARKVPVWCNPNGVAGDLVQSLKPERPGEGFKTSCSNTRASFGGLQKKQSHLGRGKGLRAQTRDVMRRQIFGKGFDSGFSKRH